MKSIVAWSSMERWNMAPGRCT